LIHVLHNQNKGRLLIGAPTEGCPKRKTQELRTKKGKKRGGDRRQIGSQRKREIEQVRKSKSGDW